jgi:hypothetical protein
MAIWDILLPFGTFCVHLEHFSGFGILYQEKSGNPGISLLHRSKITNCLFAA